MGREPGKCPEGHDCEITGIYIKCHYCDWIDDSTLVDIMVSPGYIFAEKSLNASENDKSEPVKGDK